MNVRFHMFGRMALMFSLAAVMGCGDAGSDFDTGVWRGSGSNADHTMMGGFVFNDDGTFSVSYREWASGGPYIHGDAAQSWSYSGSGTYSVAGSTVTGTYSGTYVYSDIVTGISSTGGYSGSFSGTIHDYEMHGTDMKTGGAAIDFGVVSPNMPRPDTVVVYY